MFVELTIRGLVQGVGFRPFIYRLSNEMALTGNIRNRNDGVLIEVNILSELLPVYVKRIENEKPPASIIQRIDIREIDKLIPCENFSIISSVSTSDEITQVSPDIAVCTDCLEDMKYQANRLEYPFINCTHCGPRFSIIHDLPYDRKQTTMELFAMCPDCRREYNSTDNRRFHAQPIACNHCGPFYYCIYKGQQITDYKEIVTLSRQFLTKGDVIALKGIGGYHLVCDAHNGQAVSKLREIKKRDTKPFAVLFGSLEKAERYAYINEFEKAELLSWRRPIVLLRERNKLAYGINMGLNTLGCMLAYMPIHYQWFEQLDTDALVVTSANVSDTPILITAEEAEQELSPLVPLVIHHNRNIQNRVDDSVLQVCDNETCLIRRSRGYAPEAFLADVRTDGILAFGAEKVNTFALGKNDTIIQSQHIGDLKNWETHCFYMEAMERFEHLFRFVPSALVCDLHPDYLSSREAEKYASLHMIPLLKVQHHHAHAVACMAEHKLSEKVIAVVWDGTGLGTDGKIWGGEFLLCDRTSFQRLSHTDYLPMPGGDKASKEPWRMAVSCLFYYFGKEQVFLSGLKQRIGNEKLEIVVNMLISEVNSPLSSGVGRIFDAVSSLLGCCDIASFQGEAPCRLEQIATNDFHSRYFVDVKSDLIVWYPLFKEILLDMDKNLPMGIIAAKFHNTLVWLITEKCKLLIERTNTNKVVISGGCFQNKRLTEQLMHQFKKEGIDLYIPKCIPCNDSGIAVGQLLIAAALRNE